MVYDAENRRTSAVNGYHQYRYDADGKRTRKLVTGSPELWLVYGANGELVAEYDAVIPGGTLKKEYGYRGGQMLVVYDAGQSGDNRLKWLVTDHLGSTRMLVNRSGGLCGAIERLDYLPFGEELASTIGHRNASCSGYGGGGSLRQKFGSKERDSETGLDFFGARYLSSVQGRFTSVDPLSIKKRHLANPQDLNRYAYVINNPLRYFDPDGQERIEVVINTFIPQNSVGGFEGDNRNIGQPGTHRTQQRIVIETDPTKSNGFPLLSAGKDIGTTRGPALLSTPSSMGSPGIIVPYKEGKASGDTLTAGASQDSKTGVITIIASGNEGNPNIPFAPGITYNLSISIQSAGPDGEAAVTVSGSHDGFPGYEVIVTRPEADNNSKVVYGFNPRDHGNSPLSLFPGNSVKVNQPPSVIEPRKKKENE